MQLNTKGIQKKHVDLIVLNLSLNATIVFYPRILEIVKICQNTNRLHYLLNLATIKQDNLVKVYIFEIAEL